MSTVSDYFGSMVFDDKVMRSMLSADIYRSLRKTINQGNPLNPDVANAVAQAENLTRHRFRQAVSGQLSRQEDIPHELYEQRPDLRFTGRTLFGVMPPKGQELDDHYFGSIKPEISRFMEELNDELWKLGILAKTEHNEVAPSQHELACIYAKVNVTVDQNQLVMEMIKKVAERHDFVALLQAVPGEPAGAGRDEIVLRVYGQSRIIIQGDTVFLY